MLADTQLGKLELCRQGTGRTDLAIQMTSFLFQWGLDGGGVSEEWITYPFTAPGAFVGLHYSL